MQSSDSVYAGIIISLREMGYQNGDVIPLTALHQVSWNMPIRTVKFRKAIQTCMIFNGTLIDFGDGFFMLSEAQ